MLMGVINSAGIVGVLSQREVSDPTEAVGHIFYQMSGRIKTYCNRWVLLSLD